MDRGDEKTAAVRNFCRHCGASLTTPLPFATTQATPLPRNLPRSDPPPPPPEALRVPSRPTIRPPAPAPEPVDECEVPLDVAVELETSELLETMGDDDPTGRFRR